MITVIKSQGKAYEELQAANELMYNLISNAIKFAHPGRDLRINIKSELYPEICFCMEEFKGTGIGLAICKRIVENHRGIITVTGKLNEDTMFDIYIPTSEN
jgi:signal transduction histidine kinase